LTRKNKMRKWEESPRKTITWGEKLSRLGKDEAKVRGESHRSRGVGGDVAGREKYPEAEKKKNYHKKDEDSRRQ